ncbi:ORF6N domain-containing protein [Pseudomonas iridis]|uniref:ORF6N domain-containing protein n=1 Tax=Pseudomonas iridis TaxID=2710587 RepID=UPI001B329EEC|nr:ORF6N domain-containing protein [Pseudomonas iridis]MBP5966790.1 ORF6N domain-containing protein [Pseudomonas iridis]
MTIAKFQDDHAVTMPTNDLLMLVNEARAEFGESQVRHNDFVARCRDELDGEYYETFVIKADGPGRPSEALRLTRDQCKLVAMRESKGVRRRVLARLNELESQQQAPALPQNYIQALEHLLESKRSEQLAIEQRDHAIATKAQIGAKREATAMATASAAVREAARLRDELGFSTRHATILKVEAALSRRFSFVNLRRWCKANGVTPETVPDKRYSEGVKAWPAAAWAAVFDIDLVDLFGADGEQA